MSSENLEPHPDEMRPEYDFSGGVRSKHSQACLYGYGIVIYKKEGSTEEREFALPQGTVVLDLDVRVPFPNSEAVNRTLRALLGLARNNR